MHFLEEEALEKESECLQLANRVEEQPDDALAAEHLAAALFLGFMTVEPFLCFFLDFGALCNIVFLF